MRLTLKTRREIKSIITREKDSLNFTFLVVIDKLFYCRLRYIVAYYIALKILNKIVKEY